MKWWKSRQLTQITSWTFGFKNGGYNELVSGFMCMIYHISTYSTCIYLYNAYKCDVWMCYYLCACGEDSLIFTYRWYCRYVQSFLARNTWNLKILRLTSLATLKYNSKPFQPPVFVICSANFQQVIHNGFTILGCPIFSRFPKSSIAGIVHVNHPSSLVSPWWKPQIWGLMFGRKKTSVVSLKNQVGVPQRRWAPGAKWQPPWWTGGDYLPWTMENAMGKWMNVGEWSLLLPCCVPLINVEYQ